MSIYLILDNEIINKPGLKSSIEIFNNFNYRIIISLEMFKTIKNLNIQKLNRTQKKNQKKNKKYLIKQLEKDPKKFVIAPFDKNNFLSSVKSYTFVRDKDFFVFLTGNIYDEIYGENIETFFIKDN